MLKLAHIINPVKVVETHELDYLQPITFESMRVAKENAANKVEVELLTAQYEEDLPIIPGYFKNTADLNRSVLDIGQFSKTKKLPLIQDIISKAYEYSNAEYLIFTNVDIILMPHFYEVVARYINEGHDALIINRRRIPPKFKRVEDLPLIYAESGQSHPGFDCFVFKRELYENFLLEGICVGVPFSGVSMAHNLFAFADDCLLLDQHHLTLHIGMEVMPTRDKEYYWHNRRAFNKILKQLKPHLKVKKMPYSELPIPQRWFKWALNPSTFTALNLELEGRGFIEKMRFLANEMRFKLLNSN